MTAYFLYGNPATETPASSKQYWSLFTEPAETVSSLNIIRQAEHKAAQQNTGLISTYHSFVLCVWGDGRSSPADNFACYCFQAAVVYAVIYSTECGLGNGRLNLVSEDAANQTDCRAWGNWRWQANGLSQSGYLPTSRGPYGRYIL